MKPTLIESLAHGGGVQLVIVIALIVAIIPVTILAFHGYREAEEALCGLVTALSGALLRGPGSQPQPPLSQPLPPAGSKETQ